MTTALYLTPIGGLMAFTMKLVGSNFTLASIVEVAAVATLVAGVFVVARYREALRAKESASEAWREERDAELAKSERLAAELSEERARRVALEARPDLTKLETSLGQLVDVYKEHERNAERRHQVLVKTLTSKD